MKGIDDFFDYGVHLETRALYIGSVARDSEKSEPGTDFVMAERAIKGLHLLMCTSAQPINIYMNNLGGDEYHGLAIYDAIQSCGLYSTLFVYGQAMSMGSLIVQAANRRIMMPNSTMMLHYGTWFDSGPTDGRDIRAWADEGERINALMEKIYLDRMKEKNKQVSRDDVKKLLSTDRFLTREQCIDLGLADDITS